MSRRSELIQVAASALAAAQVEECDTSAIDAVTPEGARGLVSFEKLLKEVRLERLRQELKWGTRTNETASPAFWLAVIGEEVGEVAEETHGRMTTAEAQLIIEIEDMGRSARALLENR